MILKKIKHVVIILLINRGLFRILLRKVRFLSRNSTLLIAIWRKVNRICINIADILLKKDKNIY